MDPAIQRCDFNSDKPKFEAIPLLDLSLFGEGKELNDQCLRSIAEACELGCFRVVNHGIPDDLLHSADKLCREAFNLPTLIKQKNICPNPHGGYIGQLSFLPFYESLSIRGVPNRQVIKEFSDLMWPEGNQNFCEIMEEYTIKVVELSKRLHEILLDSWGVGKYYDSEFGHDSHSTIIRMNMYAVASELPNESLGGATHTDPGSLTLVQQDIAGGLQVLNKAGNWMDVEIIPNSIVVFGGDSFKAWSNGRIHNVIHRVVVKRRQARMSLALSRAFPDDKEIRTAGELVDEQHPLRYRAYRFRDLVEYKVGKGLSGENHLEAFAGMG